MKITKLRNWVAFDPILVWCCIGFVLFTIGVIGLVYWLSTPTIEQLNEINKKLPPGCEFVELGAYGRLDPVVMVHCKSHDAVTLTTLSGSDKNERQTAVVSIND